MSDEKGASILIALFFLLICTVIAAIIVNAASVNSTQRDKDYQGSNQAYYTLSSAARLSKDAFSDSNSVLSTLSITFDSNGNKVAQTPTTTSNQLATAILAAAEAQYGKSGTREIGIYDVKAANPSTGTALTTVHLKYTMIDGDCNITVHPTLDGATTVTYGELLDQIVNAHPVTTDGLTTITWS